MNKNSDLQKFITYIENKGARPCSPLNWEIDTIYGVLKVSVWDTDFTKTGNFRKKELASIFTRFVDVERAKEFLKKNEGNTYSGKLNFHVAESSGDQRGVWEYCFNFFSFELEKILVKN